MVSGVEGRHRRRRRNRIRLGNGGGAAGTFSATFHGSVVAVESVVPQPGSVVGEFNANFSNGSVAGGFGARKQ